MFNFMVSDSTLIISFDRPYKVLSWSPLNGGLREAEHIINHHVGAGDYNGRLDPALYLERVVQRLKLKGPVVGMMTGADVTRFSLAKRSYKDVAVHCFVTAGCTNSLCVGDPAEFV